MDRTSSRFGRLVLTQALGRWEEEGQPLDDGPALRALAATERQAQMLERAERLLPLTPLPSHWRELRRLALGLGLAAALLLWLAGGGILGRALGGGHSINVLLAWWAVLGVNLLALLAWTVLALLGGAGLGGGLGGLSGWALALLRPRLAREKRLLLAEAGALARRGRLLPWLTGLFSHAVWALVMGLVLAGLWWAFAFSAYRLGWESTILAGADFAQWVHGLGRLPALLGFPNPAPDSLNRWVGSPEGHRLLALWLLGCTVVYGLLPRLLLLGLCALMLAWRQRRLTLDAAAPWYQSLARRLDRLSPARVLDAGPDDAPAVAPRGAVADRGPWALLAYETEPRQPLPQALAGAALAVLISDGGAAQQGELMQALRQLPAGLPLLVAVRATATPDRALQRWLQRLREQGHGCALCLLAPASDADRRRWRDGVAAWGQVLPVLDEAQAALGPGAWTGAVHG